ncbi:MAG: Chromosome partition protein Smc [Candidatus Hydrogenedentes bacterium ADurb.Bin101]|nr:MAG: Chromosome partition protein Smc [Candidatus Hydrogenedentes bacterium ADurb.Bin101]
MPADKETPEYLLHRAREAMSKGAVHDAKSAALGLALAMAQIELDQAEAAVAAAEQRLVENAQSIRNAQDAVDLAARNLLQTEELLATRDGECSACREHITALDDSLVQFEAELKDIDAQIEALQQRRAEQVNRIGNKQLEKEDVLNNESRLQTEIEALKQEVEGMHQHLEELQLDTKDKIDSKSGIEMDICLAREEAETRRAALEAIKLTLNPATDIPEEAPPGNGYLL